MLLWQAAYLLFCSGSEEQAPLLLPSATLVTQRGPCLFFFEILIRDQQNPFAIPMFACGPRGTQNMCKAHMSYSLNSLKGGYIEDYYRGY